MYGLDSEVVGKEHFGYGAQVQVVYKFLQSKYFYSPNRGPA